MAGLNAGAWWWRPSTPAGPAELARIVGIDRARHRFITEQGDRVFVRMLTAMMLYYRFLRGEDIRPQLAQWAAFRPTGVGASSVRYNALRVFGMAYNIPTRDMGLPAFRPQDFPDYVPRWPSFERQCNAAGFHVLLTLFPDNALIMPSLNDQQQLHGQMTAVLRGLYQLTNEWEAHRPLNEVDYWQFPKPPQMADMGFAAEGLHRACWDWFDFHPKRTYPKHLKDQNLADNPNVILSQREGMLCENDRLGPGGGSAGAGPMDAGTAFALGGAALCYGLGTSFHSQRGKVADVYDNLTAALACEFLAGSV